MGAQMKASVTVALHDMNDHGLAQALSREAEASGPSVKNITNRQIKGRPLSAGRAGDIMARVCKHGTAVTAFRAASSDPAFGKGTVRPYRQ